MSPAEKIMPKVKTNRVKFPEGWELIEPTLRELQAKMREGTLVIHPKNIGIVVATAVAILFQKTNCSLCSYNLY